LFGATVSVAPVSSEICAALFSETQSRIIISVAEANKKVVMDKLRSSNVPHSELGTVGREELRIEVGEDSCRWPVAELHDLWFNSIARAVEGDSASERIPSL